jgi:hypothetical protein
MLNALHGGTSAFCRSLLYSSGVTPPNGIFAVFVTVAVTI